MANKKLDLIRKFLGDLGPMRPVFSAKQIGAFMMLVVSIEEKIERLDVSTSDRRKLVTYLVLPDSALVDYTASALERRPELFRHFPVSAAALRGQFSRAQAWLKLRLVLQRLTNVVNDHYMTENAGVISACQELLRQVRAETRMPFPPPGTDDRAKELFEAETIMQLLNRPPEQHASIQKKRSRQYLSKAHRPQWLHLP